MALSNQERQARFQARRRELAARSEPNEALLQMMAETRRHIREWKRSVALFDGGIMRLRSNNADVSDDHSAHLRQVIETNRALLDRYDPDGLTDDGNVEVSQVPRHLIQEMWKGRPVTYRLNPDGSAVVLRAFEAVAEARMHAAGDPEAMVATVADDMWSLIPDTNSFAAGPPLAAGRTARQ
jgi:hypothetical protein